MTSIVVIHVGLFDEILTNASCACYCYDFLIYVSPFHGWLFSYKHYFVSHHLKKKSKTFSGMLTKVFIGARMKSNKPISCGNTFPKRTTQHVAISLKYHTQVSCYYAFLSSTPPHKQPKNVFILWLYISKYSISVLKKK
jgi:hypothetical protein